MVMDRHHEAEDASDWAASREGPGGEAGAEAGAESDFPTSSSSDQTSIRSSGVQGWEAGWG